MINLSHLDFGPLFYGLIIFLGLASIWGKLAKGNVLGFLVEASVFWLVFKLHGGSVAGGFAATVAALLAGLFMAPRSR